MTMAFLGFSDTSYNTMLSLQKRPGGHSIDMGVVAYFTDICWVQLVSRLHMANSSMSSMWLPPRMVCIFFCNSFRISTPTGLV